MSTERVVSAISGKDVGGFTGLPILNVTQDFNMLLMGDENLKENQGTAADGRKIPEKQMLNSCTIHVPENGVHFYSSFFLFQEYGGSHCETHHG